MRQINNADFIQFVTSMIMLRNAADEASRTGLAYFDMVTASVNGNGPSMSTAPSPSFSRAISVPVGLRAQTEDPEGADDNKRKRKRQSKPKDPDAPKKPPTPFLLFCQEGRTTVKSDMGPAVKYPEVQEELRRRWEQLSADERTVGFR
jgi:hypothetical protein